MCIERSFKGGTTPYKVRDFCDQIEAVSEGFS